MNVNTGDLYRYLGYIPEIERENVTQVPEQYKDEVLERLQGNDHVKVDMKKNTPLVDWAKRQSKKKKRQMAKASKKQNRRK